MDKMKTFTEFIFEKINQEIINKKIKELEEITDEKEIIRLKSEIEILQDKLSKE